MFAALSLLLDDSAPPGPSPKPPTLRFDSGGGGPSWPGYDVVDILGALQAFREIPGEHPVARAARRHAHIGEHLSRAKDARERREAGGSRAGATVADAAACERFEVARQDELIKIAPLASAEPPGRGRARGMPGHGAA